MIERRTLAALYNMSAPPRTQVRLRPLGVRRVETVTDAARNARGRRVSRTETKVLARPSARLFARVCLMGLLADGRANEPRCRDIAQAMMTDVPIDLVETLVALRSGRFANPWAHGDGMKGVKAAKAAKAMPLEAVHDELLERLAALDATGLPPVLLARELDLQDPAPPCVGPLLALRLLAGTAGHLFIRDRRPGTGAFLSLAAGGPIVPCQFDYWLPTTPATPATSPGGDNDV